MTREGPCQGFKLPVSNDNAGFPQLFFNHFFNNTSAMSTIRLTFLYPHLFRSIRAGEPATTALRNRPRVPARQCLNSRRGFATTGRRREQTFVQRHGKAVEPFLHEGETADAVKVFTPEEVAKGGDGKKSDKPESKSEPSSSAPLSEETQAAMKLPGDEAVEDKDKGSKEEQPTPRQQAAANTADQKAPLETILHMPPPETVEEQNASRPPHLQTPPYVHHFDTYTLVQQVEAGGFTNDQSITAMKAVRGLLALNLDVARAGLVSKSDVENESYLFRAACSELKTEIQNTRKAHEETMRRERTLLQHEVDILNQKLTQELLTLKDELKGMFDDRKMAVRTEQRAMESAVSFLFLSSQDALLMDS